MIPDVPCSISWQFMWNFIVGTAMLVQTCWVVSISLQRGFQKAGKKSTSTRPFGDIAECSTSLNEKLLQHGEGLMFLQRLEIINLPPPSAITCFPSFMCTYLLFCFFPHFLLLVCGTSAWEMEEVGASRPALSTCVAGQDLGSLEGGMEQPFWGTCLYVLECLRAEELPYCFTGGTNMCAR